ncbi:MAG: hypothetical protein AAFY15_03115, partial [Cyanobacteria bacterium J06648_11]
LALQSGGAISTSVGSPPAGSPSAGGLAGTTNAIAGQGGNITVTTGGDVLAAGENTGIFAISASPEAAGSVTVIAKDVTVRDRSTLSVSNTGAGDAGDLTVDATNLTVADFGELSAETASGNGGDITVALDDTLALRNGGSLSTSAGNRGAGGDGGNINIDAAFVTAVPDENSDITADAFDGRGGNIAIAADGVFGIVPSPVRTDSSNITASSETNVNGTISVNSPVLDPSRDVVEEPEATPPPEVSRGCQAGRIQTASSFVDLGRGGLPPAPGRSPSSAALWEDVRPLSTMSATSETFVPVSTAPVSAAPVSADISSRPVIVEAQGWIANAAGEIELVADAPDPIATVSGFSDRNCRGLPPHS